MGRNSGKGGKGQKKRKNKEVDTGKRTLQLKETDLLHEYAQIVKPLGDCRFHVSCFDGQTRTAHVPGKFRNKMRFNRDDVVLIQLREFELAKADILHLYTADEIRTLKRMGEIPAKAAASEADLNSDDDTEVVVFDATKTLDTL